jgi:phthalate 4,5-cis-dihydrodiol dehydrogenase
VLDELWEAMAEERQPRHDGTWGRATLAVCLAMLESAAANREVPVTT